MTSRIRHVTIDCTDPDTLGTFWSSVLGAPLADDDRPGDPEALLDHGNGSALLFIRNDDPKLTKNRVHLDIQPTDRPATPKSTASSNSAPRSSLTTDAPTAPDG